jgi:hypothetical protein
MINDQTELQTFSVEIYDIFRASFCMQIKRIQ